MRFLKSGNSLAQQLDGVLALLEPRCDFFAQHLYGVLAPLWGVTWGVTWVDVGCDVGVTWGVTWM